MYRVLHALREDFPTQKTFKILHNSTKQIKTHSRLILEAMIKFNWLNILNTNAPRDTESQVSALCARTNPFTVQIHVGLQGGFLHPRSEEDEPKMTFYLNQSGPQKTPV